jgi:GNAT superfamily N-acetyltransferase
MGCRCRGAEGVLSHRFRSEPALRRALRGEAVVATFFSLLVEAAGRGYPRLVCVCRGSRAVAAALYAPPRRPSAAQLARLARVLALLSPRALLDAATWLARSRAYARALAASSPGCHLLFVASAASGRGYGSEALRAVEEACAEEGGLWVALEVHWRNPALRFYAKRGYEPVAAAAYAGEVYILMRKRLRRG